MRDPFENRPTRKAKGAEKPTLLTVKIREGKDYDPQDGYGYYQWEVGFEGQSLGSAIWSYEAQGWYAETPDGKRLDGPGGRIGAATRLVQRRFPNYRYYSCTRAQSRENPNPGTYDYHFIKG